MSGRVDEILFGFDRIAWMGSGVLEDTTCLCSQHSVDFVQHHKSFATIDEDTGLGLTFKYPNYVIERLYADYFVSILQEKANLPFNSEPVNQAILALAQHGNPQPFFDQVSFVLKGLLSNRDAVRFHEGALKGIFVSLLHQQQFYYIHSEYESSRQYVDIFLETIKGYKPNYEIGIELKYVKKGDKRNINALLDEAETQLREYMTTYKFNLRANVKAFVVVAQGYKLTWRAV